MDLDIAGFFNSTEFFAALATFLVTIFSAVFSGFVGGIFGGPAV
ncbi:MAG: hypothetical protein ACPGXK_12065 [Phycisphaerae bacterium]